MVEIGTVRQWVEIVKKAGAAVVAVAELCEAVLMAVVPPDANRNIQRATEHGSLETKGDV